MLSDGRILPRALKKLSCLGCGATSHASAIAGSDVRDIYDSGYSLAGAAPRSDAARARAYCRWIESECSPPQSILEIGCGSGSLLRELLAAWPESRGYGVDPALPENLQSDDRIRLQRGFVEDIPDGVRNFDLIVAVNVIEHMPNPGKFLTALHARLTPKGRIVVVCPATDPPNVELLFYDHLYSLTPEALGNVSRTTGLVATRRRLAPPEIGDFQMIVFDTRGPQIGILPPRHRSFSELCAKRQSYFERWLNLDSTLLERSNPASRLVAFGGGQTAALLRGYAPRTWARVELIVLDDVTESWALGPPIASYRDAVHNLADAKVLIATAPRSQAGIADRLRGDGVKSITWNDWLSN
jgi:SAM-dependent methyltransferase